MLVAVLLGIIYWRRKKASSGSTEVTFIASPGPSPTESDFPVEENIGVVGGKRAPQAAFHLNPTYDLKAGSKTEAPGVDLYKSSALATLKTEDEALVGGGDPTKSLEPAALSSFELDVDDEFLSFSSTQPNERPQKPNDTMFDISRPVDREVLDELVRNAEIEAKTARVNHGVGPTDNWDASGLASTHGPTTWNNHNLVEQDAGPVYIPVIGNARASGNNMLADSSFYHQPGAVVEEDLQHLPGQPRRNRENSSVTRHTRV